MNVFESMALYVSDMTASELLHIFVWGLKYKIKSEVRLSDPKTLIEVVKMAMDIYKRLNHSAPIISCIAVLYLTIQQ